MPKLEVEGVGIFEVEDGKRLVLAIEEDAGVDIMHACGSYAKCTFADPASTKAQKVVLSA
jgi:ferredoxin